MTNENLNARGPLEPIEEKDLLRSSQQSLNAGGSGDQ